jgi:hypothetical protein
MSRGETKELNSYLLRDPYSQRDLLASGKMSHFHSQSVKKLIKKKVSDGNSGDEDSSLNQNNNSRSSKKQHNRKRTNIRPKNNSSWNLQPHQQQ